MILITKQATVIAIMIFFSHISLHNALKTVTNERAHPAASIHRGLNDFFLECTVHTLQAFALPGIEGPSPQRLSCSAENHGPTVLLQGDHEKFFSNEVVSGVTSLKIPTDLISANMRVNLDDPAASKMITILDGELQTGRGLRGANNKRSLRNDYDGTFRVLVIRVSDERGNSPTHSAEDISKHVFTSDVSMANQYRACSNGILQFDPAQGSDVVDGVLDISVDADLSMSWESEGCINAADDFLSANKSLDLGTYDYTMYICPDVVDFGAAVGVADVNGSKSWYLDTYGSMPFVQMHEIGHNLFFYHSTEGGKEYGDPTCVMGGVFVESENWGKMCFNAAKTYTTGWYSNHHGEVSPEAAPYNGNIVDINSASEGRIRTQDDVVVRVRAPRDINNLYFMLHRLEGITSDMFPGDDTNYIETHANRVNVIRQFYPKGASSEAVAHLANDDEYVESNWSSSGKALHIKVCSITDRGAKVIVYLEGDTFTSCEEDDDNDTTSAPTSTPVASSPTVAPTKSPPVAFCVDSSLKMYIRGGAIKSCSWVANNNTELRCQIPGVASHCPVTCGTCILCTDSGKRFQMKNEAKTIKSCSWVRNVDTESRCQKEGVSSACRATCGTCNA